MADTATIQMLTNELHDLTIKCETQENTMQTMELEHKAIEEELAKLKIENEELLNKNELLENFKKEMGIQKQMFHSSLMEMEAVNKKNVELHDQISQKTKNIQNLNKENSQIKSENKQYIANMEQYIHDRMKQQKKQNDTAEREQTIEILKLENQDLNEKLNHIMTEYNDLNVQFKQFTQSQTDQQQVHSDFSDEVQKETLQNVKVHFSPRIRPISNRTRIDSTGTGMSSDGVPSTVPENQIARNRLDSSGTFASSDGGPVLFSELVDHAHEHSHEQDQDDDFGFGNEQEQTPEVQLEDVKAKLNKELMEEITLDGMCNYLCQNNVVKRSVMDLQRFVANEEFDTESIVYDVDECLNVRQTIDGNSVRLMEEYLLKDYKRLFLKSLKDYKYNGLVAMLGSSMNWNETQILCMLRWIWTRYTENGSEFNDLNEAMLETFWKQNHEILPQNGLKDLNACTESIKQIHTNALVSDMDNKKCDIRTCKSLNCIIETLLYFDQNQKNEDIFIMDYFQNIDFVGHYIHLLSIHMNDPIENENQFQFIYKRILDTFKRPCDLWKCKRFKRKYQRRTGEILREDTLNNGNKTVLSNINDSKINFYKDLLDSLHVWLMHSYDLGLRLNYFKIEDLISGKINNILYDHVQTRQKNFEALPGEQMINKGKFCSFGYSIHNNNSDDEKKEDETDKDSESEEIKPKKFISFGHRYYFWKYFKHNARIESYQSPNAGSKYSEWYIGPKYDNLKHELLHNNVYRLNINIFNDAIVSVINLSASYYCKKILCQKQYHFMNIKVNDALDLEHLLSVVLHCNYSMLSYNLRMCHYATDKEITISPNTIKQRNSEYYNLSKLLRETVDCFGTPMIDSDISYFYHGIDTQIAVSSFISYFCGPTCVSIKWQVVAIGNPGMILKLQTNDEYGRNLRYFDCNWISLHPEFDEKLLFGATSPVQFSSITLTKTISGIKNYSLKTFKVLCDVLEGKQIDLLATTKSEIERKFTVIHKYMEFFIYSNKYYRWLISPKMYQKQKVDWFGNKLFTQLCKNVNEIKINLSCAIIKQYQPFFLFDHNISKLLRFDFIAAVFSNCQTIKIYNTGEISQEFVHKLITNITKILQLQKEINCKLSRIELFGISIPFNVFLSPFEEKGIYTTLKEMEYRTDLIIYLNKQKPTDFKHFIKENDIFENEIPISYWDNYRGLQGKYKYFCLPNHKNIKDELLNNEIWKLSKNEFDIAKEKANAVNRFKHLCQSNGDWNKICGIKENDIISLQHTLAIIVFAENIQLRIQMNKIRHKLSMNESIYSVMSRIANFAHCFRLVCEAILLFGTIVDKNEKFYCGLEKEYDLLPFEITVNQPKVMLNNINKSQFELFENCHTILQCKPINGRCFRMESLQKTIFFNCKLAINGMVRCNNQTQLENNDIQPKQVKKKDIMTSQKVPKTEEQERFEQQQRLDTLFSAFI